MGNRSGWIALPTVNVWSAIVFGLNAKGAGSCGAAVAVAVKVTDCVIPEARAVTVYVPGVPPSVNRVSASPFEPVVALEGDTVPLGVTENDTDTPDIAALF